MLMVFEMKNLMYSTARILKPNKGRNPENKLGMRVKGREIKITVQVFARPLFGDN